MLVPQNVTWKVKTDTNAFVFCLVDVTVIVIIIHNKASIIFFFDIK